MQGKGSMGWKSSGVGFLNVSEKTGILNFQWGGGGGFSGSHTSQSTAGCAGEPRGIVSLGPGSAGTRLSCAGQTLSLSPSEPLPVGDLA